MIHKWWHVFIRKRTKAIPADDAFKWKRRLSVAYGVLAWNALGVVVYCIAQGKGDWADYYGIKSEEEKAMPPGQAWARTLGLNNLKVYRISGLKVVDEYDVVEGDLKRPDQPNKNVNTEELKECNEDVTQ